MLNAADLASLAQRLLVPGIEPLVAPLVVTCELNPAALGLVRCCVWAPASETDAVSALGTATVPYSLNLVCWLHIRAWPGGTSVWRFDSARHCIPSLCTRIGSNRGNPQSTARHCITANKIRY